ADQRHERWQGIADGFRLLHRDAPAALAREDHADLVGALAGTEKRVGDRAHAAELDLHARTSARVADSGSAAEESASPTSSMDAPSARQRRTSSAVRTPLSATRGAIPRASGAIRPKASG